MQIEMKTIERMSIEDFADKHGLVMVVNERRIRSVKLAPFYAHFKNAEVLRGRFLLGTFGDGSTPEEAIKDYALQISRATLVINANGNGRREIDVPILEDKQPNC